MSLLGVRFGWTVLASHPPYQDHRSRLLIYGRFQGRNPLEHDQVDLFNRWYDHGSLRALA